MCKIKEKADLKEFTGYKVALKVDGKYYSPATGIEYKLGPVTVATEKGKYIDCCFEDNLLNPESRIFNNAMHGNTALFEDKQGALRLMSVMNRDFLIVILKMTLSDLTYYGEYLGYRVILGKNIVQLSEEPL